MLLLVKVAAGAILGCLTHLLFFIRGEHILQAPKIFCVYCALLLLLVAEESYYHNGVLQSLRSAYFIAASYAIALWTSMTVYRIFFHQLRHYPGPSLARVTKLWHVWQVRGRQNHLVLESLRKKYGDFVRTGPSEITVFDPEIYNAISGPRTRCDKADMYDMVNPLTTIVTMREKSGYSHRRKAWDIAMRNASQTNEAVILKHAQQLCDHIISQEGSSLVVSDYFNYYTIDIIGEIGFGQDFQMLKMGRTHPVLEILTSGMHVFGTVTPTPWLARLLLAIPQVTATFNKMLAWSKQTIDARMAQADTKDQGDASYWFLETARDEHGTYDFDALYGDAFALFVAGRDSVSSTLIYLFYELARNETVQDKLQREIDTIPIGKEANDLKELPYLRACIDETLRLHPVALTAGYRNTLDTGIEVAGHYIPPYTTVVAPRYSISRLESCFSRATEFIPERWTDQPELIKDIRAFVPFNLGRHSCAGRQIALIEIRILTILLLQRFRVSLTPGERNKTQVVDERTDNLTARPGRLELEFEKRAEKAF